MKKFIITLIAAAIGIIATADGTKMWLYSHSGNHQSIDVADVDSISYTAPKSVGHPVVAPTNGAYTIVFKAPELACYNDLVINMFGDFQDNDPSDRNAPVAVALNDANYPEWYKIVVYDYQYSGIKGKLCPRKKTGVGTWNYQASDYNILEGEAWTGVDFGQALYLDKESKNSTVYLEVTGWAANPCGKTNSAGMASFYVSIDVPNSIDKDDILLSIEGMGDGLEWGFLTYLEYNKSSGLWTAEAEVPANCQFKCAVIYNGIRVYQDGDNLTMPVSRIVNVTVAEWDGDPWNN